VIVVVTTHLFSGEREREAKRELAKERSIKSNFLSVITYIHIHL